MIPFCVFLPSPGFIKVDDDKKRSSPKSLEVNFTFKTYLQDGGHGGNTYDCKSINVSTTYMFWRTVRMKNKMLIMMIIYFQEQPKMMNIMLIMMITKVERNRPPGGERSVISG